MSGSRSPQLPLPSATDLVFIWTEKEGSVGICHNKVHIISVRLTVALTEKSHDFMRVNPNIIHPILIIYS